MYCIEKLIDRRKLHTFTHTHTHTLIQRQERLFEEKEN